MLRSQRPYDANPRTHPTGPPSRRTLHHRGSLRRTNATWSTMPSCWNWLKSKSATRLSSHDFPGDDCPIVQADRTESLGTRRRLRSKKIQTGCRTGQPHPESRRAPWTNRSTARHRRRMAHMFINTIKQGTPARRASRTSSHCQTIGNRAGRKGTPRTTHRPC